MKINYCDSCPIAPCIVLGVIGYDPEFKRKVIEDIEKELGVKPTRGKNENIIC